jgi:hypothetical protein
MMINYLAGQQREKGKGEAIEEGIRWDCEGMKD